MKYEIDQQVLAKFPDFHRGVVVASGINNSRQNLRLGAMLDEAWRRAQSDPTLGSQPQVLVWDEAYKRFGANPNRDTPSIKFLLSQARKGKSLRSINPLVDILNVVSLEHSLPCGGDDLDALAADGIMLTFARGDETFASLGKPDHVESPIQGEVVYLTLPSRRVMCRRWNWRNAHFSRLTEATTRVAINIDSFIPPTESAVLHDATEKMAQLIQEFCGGKVVGHYVSANIPSFDIE